MLRPAIPLAVAALLATPAASQLPPKLSWVDILEPSNPAIEDFGSHLAVDEDGNRLAVTARSVGVLFGSTWSVFVFERSPSGWIETQELVSPVAGTWLPRTLALHGDVLVVSDAVGTAGMLFVYRDDGLGTWSLEAQFDPHPQYQNNGSGPTVATTGDTIFAGWVDVHVFVEDPSQPSGWRLEGPLPKPLGTGGFGRALDAVGNRLVVGSNYEAHVFDRDPQVTPGWSQTGYLGPFHTDDGSLMLEGEVAVWGDTAVVGHPDLEAGDGVIDYGAAFVYGEDAGGSGAWDLAGKITSVGTSTGFAETVDVGSDHLVAMDQGSNVTGGQARLFQRVPLPGPDSWKQVGWLGANQLGPYTQVRVAGGEVLVGSVDDSLHPTGSVQVFAMMDPNVFPSSTTFP